MAPGAAYASATGPCLKSLLVEISCKGLSFTDRFQLQRRRKWSVMDYLGLGYRTGNYEFLSTEQLIAIISLSKEPLSTHLCMMARTQW